MLVVRSAQIESFGQDLHRRFEDQLCRHVQQHFPAECQQLGAEGTGVTVRHGVETARSYGITDQRDLAVYLDVMFTYGRDFDHDPRLPWAAATLNDPDFGTGTDKVEFLLEASLKHLEIRPSGPEA